MTKDLKQSSGKKTVFSTIDAGSTGGQHVGECKLIHSYILEQSSSPSRSRYIKQDTLKLIEEKVEKSLKHMGTEENFLNRTHMAYALRQRTLSKGQNSKQQTGKRYLPILHHIES